MAEEPSEGIVLCAIDLDDFKRINDIYGHQAGDEVLCNVVRGLSRAARGRGILMRMGGDEFELALRKGDQAALDGLREFAQKPHQASFNGMMVRYSISAGAALMPDDAQDLHSLAGCADLALYHMKLQGKHGFSFFKKENTQSDRIEMGFSRYEIQESFPCGILVCKSGRQAEILYANRQLLNSLGFASLRSMQEACGGCARGLFHPDDARRIERLAEGSLSSGANAIGCERFRTLTGGSAYKTMVGAGQLARSDYYGEIWYVVMPDEGGKGCAQCASQGEA